MNNNCKLINIVWIDRGIILTLVHYIVKFYDKLLDKTVIVNSSNYRKILKILFPKIKFKKFKKDRKDNFYFNIRNIIKKQDIIIDYLSNYNNDIHTKKVDLVPWYDMNDILISYVYNDTKSLLAEEYDEFIKDFSKCRRGSYYDNMIWDMYMELKILKDYSTFTTKNINSAFNTINQFVKRNYTHTVVNNNYYIPYPVNNMMGNSMSNSRGNSIGNSMSNSMGNSMGNTMGNNMSNMNSNMMGNIIQKSMKEPSILRDVPLQSVPNMNSLSSDTNMDDLIIMINGMINNINNLII